MTEQTEQEEGAGVWVTFMYDLGPVAFAVHPNELEARRYAQDNFREARFLPFGEDLK